MIIVVVVNAGEAEGRAPIATERQGDVYLAAGRVIQEHGAMFEHGAGVVLQNIRLDTVSQLSLCLSRACLCTVIVLIAIEWLKRGGVSHR